MPNNRFSTLPKAELLTYLKAVQLDRLTGPRKILELLGLNTEHDTSKVNLDTLETELKYSLSVLDPDNYDSPYDQRPGVTIQARY